MTLAIKATYQDGIIFLNTKPTYKVKKEVTILFEKEHESNPKRVSGTLKGKVSIPDNFDEPLDELNEYLY